MIASYSHHTSMIEQRAAIARAPSYHMRWYEAHAERRTGMPDASHAALTSVIWTSWRWKMPAARPASALVAANMAVKCAGEPAPDEAITGMLTHFFMCAIS